jgi:glycosyltransferase involved in cell wall biosynthesis
VASAVGGLPEVITTGVSGLLVPAGNEEAFVEAVLALLRDPVRGRRLGEAARRFIEEDYSLARAVREVERTYAEMLTPCA